MRCNILTLRQTNNNAEEIDLAESYHLWGVTQQSLKQLLEAKRALQKALEMWDIVVSKTKEYPIRFVTMQCLANIQIFLKEYDAAIALLLTTHKKQLQYFKIENQFDISKTLRFLGEAYENKKDNKKALEAFIRSLKIGKSIGISSDVMNLVHDGIDRVVSALNETFAFNWNDYRTIKSSEINIVKIDAAVEVIMEMLKENKNYVLGSLCYKLGTFDNHVRRTPAAALKKLRIAEEILVDDDLAPSVPATVRQKHVRN